MGDKQFDLGRQETAAIGAGRSDQDTSDVRPSLVGGITVTADGQRHLFGPTIARITIGRDLTNDVTVENEHISRQHLELIRSGPFWQAVNLSRTTGTTYNGHEMMSLPIRELARLQIGGQTGVVIELEPIAEVIPRVTRFSDLIDLPPAELSAVSSVPVVIPRLPGSAVVRIGRDPGNDVVLNDLQVSRFHAEVEFRDGEDAMIRDLGSSNGTYIDGYRTRQALLQPDSVVSLGHTSLTLRGGELVRYRDEGLLDFDVEGLVVLGHSDRVLLRDLSLSVPPRTLLGVLGPSGAGKSTFIKAIVGAIPVAQGEVLYGGVNLLKSLDAARQSIGYVPQDDILHSALTVERSLTYAARLRLSNDVTDDEVGALVATVLVQLGLQGHEQKRVGQLSGGQRKRVSTAMELLTEPPLLVLDEPSSGLDPGNEKALMELLHSLAKQESDGRGQPAGRRVVVVTHSVQSLELCDLVLILAPGPAESPGGRIAFYGPPEYLLEYFDVEDAAEVFRALEAESDRDWSGQFTQSRFYEPTIHTDGRAENPKSVRSPLGWFQQWHLLTGRYLRVMLADTANLAILAAQAPAIGIMLALVGGNAFEFGPRGQPASKLIILLLGLILAITYVGASNSIREVVKERPIFLREQALGLRPSAYLASKLGVLVTITSLQAFLLTLFGTITAGTLGATEGVGPLGREPLLGILVVMIIAGAAAVSLGLMISSLVTSSDKAMSLLPVALLSMYLLSGGPTGVDDTPVLAQLSQLNSARHGLSGAAMLADAPTLLGCPPTSESPAQDSPPQDGPGAGFAAQSEEHCREEWTPTTRGLATSLAAPALLASVMLSGAVLQLSRRRY